MDDDDEDLKSALEKIQRFNRAVRVLNIAYSIVINEQKRINAHPEEAD